MPLDNSTEADRRLVAMMDEAMEDALSVTKSWLDIWTDGYNYIFNNQLAGKQRKDGWEKISANYIWPAIRQRLSSLALRTPQVYAKAWNPDQQSKADLWNGVLQWQYEKELKMQALNLAAMLDGEMYGYYVGKMEYSGFGISEDSPLHAALTLFRHDERVRDHVAAELTKRYELDVIVNSKGCEIVLPFTQGSP